MLRWRHNFLAFIDPKISTDRQTDGDRHMTLASGLNLNIYSI